MLHPAYFVIIIASACNVLSQQNDPPDADMFSSVMLDTARRLCPYANICSNYTDNKSQETSCCKDCSCDISCSVTGDCCFPTETDKATLYNQRENQECIAPTTVDISPVGYVQYQFYYMTSSCPVEKKSTTNKDCGSFPVAPWGSLYPIYSRSTGKIYKNRVCADCHGVQDGVFWEAYMSCKIVDKSQTFYLSVAEYFEGLSENLFSEYCQMYFTFRQTLDSEICFRDIIDTCYETKPVVYNITDMTRNQVVESCTKGIAAPFRYIYTYANVFCYLCNGGPETENCQSINSGRSGPPESANGLMFLLDTSVLTSVTQIRKRKNQSRPKACLDHNALNQAADTCVDVFCPSGQIYDKDFKCFHPASIWRVPMYHIALRLKFDSLLINESTLMSLLHSGGDVRTWTHCPWPMRWTINELYYELEIGNNNKDYVGSFIVFLKTHQNGEKHKSVLNKIQYFMTKTWKIKALREDISLTQQFLEYDRLIVSWKLDDQLVPDWYHMLMRFKLTGKVPFFRRKSIQPILNPKSYLPEIGRINKMNFCKTISLGSNRSDYQIFADNKLLSFNGTFFYDGKFEVISKADGTLEPRICLDDSLFIEQPLDLSSLSATSSVWLLLLHGEIILLWYLNL